MLDDDGLEGRLCELLRDPGWSLPPWPDTQARIRRAARRQRIKATGLAAGTGVIAVAAVTVPLALSGGGVRGHGEGVQGTVGVVQGTPAAASHASTSPPRPAARVLMPDVTGLELRAAKAVIRSAVSGPDIIVRHVKSSGPPGVVIAQLPAPGARVGQGGRITLKVPSAS